MLRKFACLIFILYILILLSQPCQDVFALPNDMNSKQVASIQTEIPGDPGSPNGEACSPFCICSCCSLSVADQNFTVRVTLDAEVGPIAAPPLHYASPYNKTYQNYIFQPPKA